MLLELFVELVTTHYGKNNRRGSKGTKSRNGFAMGAVLLDYLLLPFWRALSILIFLHIQLKAFHMIFEMPCLIGFNPLR